MVRWQGELCGQRYNIVPKALVSTPTAMGAWSLGSEKISTAGEPVLGDETYLRAYAQQSQ